jgi:hypothetical protein
MHRIAIAVPLLIGLGLAPTSAQQAGKAAGVLTCTSTLGTERRGLDSAHAVSCAFKSAESNKVERYVGLVNSKAAGEKRVLIWSVVTPNAKVEPGALAQRYSVAAEAPMLVGASSAIGLRSEASSGASEIMELELRLASETRT